jgi:hypothetical protein
VGEREIGRGEREIGLRSGCGVWMVMMFRRDVAVYNVV